jgi:hypothetical protein
LCIEDIALHLVLFLDLKGQSIKFFLVHARVVVGSCCCWREGAAVCAGLVASEEQAGSCKLREGSGAGEAFLAQLT